MHLAPYELIRCTSLVLALWPRGDFQLALDWFEFGRARGSTLMWTEDWWVSCARLRFGWFGFLTLEILLIRQVW